MQDYSDHDEYAGDKKPGPGKVPPSPIVPIQPSPNDVVKALVERVNLLSAQIEETNKFAAFLQQQISSLSLDHWSHAADGTKHKQTNANTT